MRRENRLVIHDRLPCVSRERSAQSEAKRAGAASGEPAARIEVRRPKLARLGGLRMAGASLTPVVLALAMVASLGGFAAPRAIAAPAPPQIGVVVAFGPPALPVYSQPPLPGPGHMWVPGYWAWDPYYGYFWVPGTWVLAPFPGALWTPGYWWWSDADDGYLWAPGYWGPAVGYYGGIDYGYGYSGYGYDGGYWRDRRFYYNRSVTNITVRNFDTVYDGPGSRDFDGPRVSYHGGRGGTTARPTHEEMRAERERRLSATSTQLRQVEVARADPEERASVDHGRPAVAATIGAGRFTGREVVPAKRAGARYQEPPIREARPTAPAQTPRAGYDVFGARVPVQSRTPTERVSPRNPRAYREQPPARPRSDIAHSRDVNRLPAPQRAAPSRNYRPEPRATVRRVQPQERGYRPQPPERRSAPEPPQFRQRQERPAYPAGRPQAERAPRPQGRTRPPGRPR
jgi:hypothetical protein